MTAHLKLRFRGRGELAHQRTATADASGGYTLAVPYPACNPRTLGSDDTEVVAAGPYQITVNGAPAGRAVVTVEQVRCGATVPVTVLWNVLVSTRPP